MSLRGESQRKLIPSYILACSSWPPPIVTSILSIFRLKRRPRRRGGGPPSDWGPVGFLGDLNIGCSITMFKTRALFGVSMAVWGDVNLGYLKTRTERSPPGLGCRLGGAESWGCAVHPGGLVASREDSAKPRGERDLECQMPSFGLPRSVGHVQAGMSETMFAGAIEPYPQSHTIQSHSKGAGRAMALLGA